MAYGRKRGKNKIGKAKTRRSMAKRNAKSGRYAIRGDGSVSGRSMIRDGRSSGSVRTYSKRRPDSVSVGRGSSGASLGSKKRRTLPVLSGGDDPTLARRFEEELYRLDG